MALLTAPAVTGNVAEVAPCGTVIETGTVTAGFEEERLIAAPPFGAAEVSCTVPMPDWPLTRVLGERATLLRAAEGGSTVTAALTVAPE